MTTQRDAQPADGRGGRGARQRILNTATDLFYREGINATGVERLAGAVQVSKRTLYQHFPSKAAVVEEYSPSSTKVQPRCRPPSTTPRAGHMRVRRP
jgi:AcrR family transcriptional regulator